MNFSPSGPGKIFSWLLLGMLLLSVGFAAFPAHGADYAEDRLLVLPKSEREVGGLALLHTRNRISVLRRHAAFGGLQVVRLPPGMSIGAALKLHRDSGFVAYAEPDYKLHHFVVPDDPAVKSGTQWHLNNLGFSGGKSGIDIDAVDGWDIANSPTNIIVAVVDSGIRYTHEDLAANMWHNPREIPGNGIDDDGNGLIDDVYGIDAIANTGDPIDTVGHGTHTAGIIGAVGGNGLGGSGVAWAVQLMACKFMGSDGQGLTSDAIQCLDYARANGAKVVNCSWGGAGNSISLSSAFQRLNAAGVVVVVAAGNEASNNDIVPSYPANYAFDNILSVAATTASDTLASFSNYGLTSVDIGAPGAAIYSTWYSGDRAYSTQSGTSMAAPVVSGVVAVMRGRFPAESPPQIIERLLASTDPIPSLAGKSVTGGRVNLKRALSDGTFADFTASTFQGTPPLSVQFTNTTRGPGAGWLWDFGDGSTSREASPSHVFRSEGNFNVTLTVTSPDGNSSSKTRKIASLGNYEIRPEDYAWIDASNLGELTLSDNGVSDPLPIGFAFRYYAQNYDSVFVSANGMLGFSADSLGTSANITIPSSTTPNAIICPYWDNLNPAAGGSVRAGLTGTAPNRRFVASWEQVPLNSGGARMTFQAVMEESSGRIVFQYQEVQPQNIRGGGRSATVGLENETGLVGIRHLLNGAPTTLSNLQALAFVPKFTEGLRVSPVTSFTSSGAAGGAFTPSILPLELKNAGGEALTWNALKKADWLDLSPEFGILEPGETASLNLRLNSNANRLGPGSYLDTVEIVNLSSGLGNAQIPVSLTVNGQAGFLTLAEDVDFSFSGFAGGPFAPSTKVYTLLNTGDATLDWSVRSDVSWVEVNPSSGRLAPGESGFASVRTSAAALDLVPADYAGVLTFSNDTDGRGGGLKNVAIKVLASSAPTLSLRLSFDSFDLSLAGDPGSAYVLEVSTDLSTWESKTEGVFPSDGLVDLGAITPSGSLAFYRVRLVR